MRFIKVMNWACGLLLKSVNRNNSYESGSFDKMRVDSEKRKERRETWLWNMEED